MCLCVYVCVRVCMRAFICVMTTFAIAKVDPLPKFLKRHGLIEQGILPDTKEHQVGFVPGAERGEEVPVLLGISG